MSQYLKLCLIFLLTLVFQLCSAVKCRSEDGPSEAELKRVTRSCMRKISENVHNNYRYNGNSHSHNNNYDQQNNYDEYSNEDSDMNYSDGYSYNTEYNIASNRNTFQQRNRERGSMLNNRNNENGNSGYANNGGHSNNQRGTNTKSNNNNYDNNNNNNKSNNKNNHNQHNEKSSSSLGNGRSNSDNNRNDTTNRHSKCVVHCFFDEMNMLNKDGYPDRHKILFMLTKDMRDLALKNFYTDTIQLCFRYLESQRHDHDKCQFSNELIHCMTEYAEATCEDWQDYSFIFN